MYDFKTRSIASRSVRSKERGNANSHKYKFKVVLTWLPLLRRFPKVAAALGMGLGAPQSHAHSKPCRMITERCREYAGPSFPLINYCLLQDVAGGWDPARWTPFMPYWYDRTGHQRCWKKGYRPSFRPGCYHCQLSLDLNVVLARSACSTCDYSKIFVTQRPRHLDQKIPRSRR